MLSTGTGHLRPQHINYSPHHPPNQSEYRSTAPNGDGNVPFWADRPLQYLTSSASGQPPQPVRVVPSVSDITDDNKWG